MHFNLNIAVPVLLGTHLLITPLSSVGSTPNHYSIDFKNTDEFGINEAHTDGLRLRLYANNENLVLRYTNGNSVLFKPNRDQFAHRLLNHNSHSNEVMGTIETQNSQRIWRSNHNIKIEFLGSYPVAISSGEHRLDLKYENSKLSQVKISSKDGRFLQKNHAQILSEITSQLAQAEQTTCSDEADEQCNDPDTPPPVGFNQPHHANDMHINIRPADCRSFFTTFPSIERGTEIEQALSEHAPYQGSESGAHSFPVADYWNNGNVYVLISRDLTAPSYHPIFNPDGFYEQLISDGENIQENFIQVLATEGQISNTAYGQTTTLHETQAQVVYLDIVAQFGVMTDSQRDQFNRAAEELLSLYGFVLRLVMIP